MDQQTTSDSPGPHAGNAPPPGNSSPQASWPVDPNYQSVPKSQLQQVPQRITNPLRSQLETVARAAMDTSSLPVQPQSIPMYPQSQPALQHHSASPMYPPSQPVPFQPSFQIGRPMNPYSRRPTGQAIVRLPAPKAAPKAVSQDPRLLSKQEFERRIAEENETFKALEEERRRSSSNAKRYLPPPSLEKPQTEPSQQTQPQESEQDFLKQVALDRGIAAEKARAASNEKAETKRLNKQREEERLEALKLKRAEEFKEKETRYEEMNVSVIKLENSTGESVLLRWDAVEMQVIGDNMAE